MKSVFSLLAIAAVTAIGTFAVAQTPPTAETKIECDSGGAQHITLDWQPGLIAFSGTFNDNYNGATLACHRFSWQPTLGDNHKLACAGVWDTSLSSKSDPLPNTVLINIERVDADHARANYLLNWDGRSTNMKTRTLDCTISG